MCNTMRGLIGLECRDLCLQGQMILAMCIISSIFGLGSAALCMYFRFHNLKRKSVPVLATLMLTGLGFFGFGIEGIVATFSTVGFRDFSVVAMENGRLIRRSPQSLEYTVSILYGISASMGTCVLFVLPLAWVSWCRHFFCKLTIKKIGVSGNIKSRNNTVL